MNIQKPQAHGPARVLFATAALLLTGCSPVPGDEGAGAQEQPPDAEQTPTAQGQSQEPSDEPSPDADADSAAPEPSATTPVDDYTAELSEVDPTQQQACLPGNWYPQLGEWEELREAGLQLPVEHLAGGFVLMIDDSLEATLEAWELEYRVTDGDGVVSTVENGESTWELEVTDVGARTVRDSLDDSGFTADTIVTDDGEETHASQRLPPIVFDRETLRCDADEITLVNPFGHMTLGREH